MMVLYFVQKRSEIEKDVENKYCQLILPENSVERNETKKRSAIYYKQSERILCQEAATEKGREIEETYRKSICNLFKENVGHNLLVLYYYYYDTDQDYSDKEGEDSKIQSRS